MYTSEEPLTPILQWTSHCARDENQIPTRKIAAPPDGWPTIGLSLKPRFLASFGVAWSFGRFPADNHILEGIYGDSAREHKEKLAELMQSGESSTEILSEIREIMLKLTDHLSPAPRTRFHPIS